MCHLDNSVYDLSNLTLIKTSNILEFKKYKFTFYEVGKIFNKSEGIIGIIYKIIPKTNCP